MIVGWLVWFALGALGWHFITEAWVHDFGDMSLGTAILWALAIIIGPFLLIVGLFLYFATGAANVRMPKFLKIVVKKQKKD